MKVLFGNYYKILGVKSKRPGPPMIDLGTHQSLVLRPPKSQPSQKRNERRRKKWCQKYGGISPPGEWLKHEGCTYTMVLPNTEGNLQL